jgi:hypothetical protein
MIEAGGAYPRSCPTCGLSPHCAKEAPARNNPEKILASAPGRTSPEGHETPQSISLWSVSTFGSVPLVAIAARMGMEVSELLTGLTSALGKSILDDQRDALQMECADINIMLSQLCEHLKVPKDHWDGAIEVAQTMPSLTRLGLASNINRHVSWLIDSLLASEEVPKRKLDNLGQDLVRHHVLLIRIQLLRVTTLLGADLQAVTNEKMAINRNRTWAKTATGRMQHV